jgi:hypothetical protein
MSAVLDACCGSRMMWFNRSDSRALFIDNRKETYIVDNGHPSNKGRKPIVISPDFTADFTALPVGDESFNLVVFDPPHVIREQPLGKVTKRYGVLNGDWQGMISKGFGECFRVLKPGGTLIFKWAETQIPITKILALTPEKPLFGHKTNRHTRWIVFIISPVEKRSVDEPELFLQVEPKEIDYSTPGCWDMAEVGNDRTIIGLGDATFTVEQARVLRDWLNTVLPS